MSDSDRPTLALDQGGHASRALVFGAGGRIVARAEQAVNTRRDGDRVEQDPEELVDSLLTAGRRAAAEAGSCLAAGLATQRSSIVCWERDSLRPLTPVLSWQDRRAADRLQALEAHAERVARITGLRLSPHYGAGKLAWCLDRVPAVRRALKRGNLAAGPLASFLLARLLDERPCLADPANGTRTLLYDRRRCDWSDGMLALFGIPRAVLPDAVANRYPFGHLMIDGKRLPLTVCTGDQSAALFALGDPAPGTVMVNAGTGAFVQQAVPAAPEPGRLLAGLAWHGEATTVHTLEGTVNGAGAALSHAARWEGITEEEMFERLPGALAGNREPPLFLNGVGGLGSPFWRPRFAARFEGGGDREGRLAAVVESIAFLVHANLAEMAAMGAPARRIVLTGGLARLDEFVRQLAALADVPVERPAFTEATARGLAWLTAGRPAGWPDGDTKKTEPRPDPALERRYRHWRRAMDEAADQPGPG